MPILKYWKTPVPVSNFMSSAYNFCKFCWLNCYIYCILMAATLSLLGILMTAGVLWPGAKSLQGSNSTSSEVHGQFPTVITKCGRLQGKVIQTRKGDCDAYLGVPFAAPPVGHFRWKKPKKLECWTGIREAEQFGPGCIQWFSSDPDPKTESEDCLYLNVFVPKRQDHSEPLLPVMVYIHGGGFSMGSAAEFGQNGLCENLASRGVIVATIQYRLGLYGFLSTGDKAALGNFGLWDQIEALKWVKENIAHFGGDSNKVTIFGESAGGASVSYLTYTPMAKDLFNQSITMSGSVHAWWGALQNNSVSTANRLAVAANCTGDSDAVLNCLRLVPTGQLQKIMQSVAIDGGLFTFMKNFGFRVDGELFTQSEWHELNTGKPAIIGVNSREMPGPEVSDIPRAQLVLNKTLDWAFSDVNPDKRQVLEDITRFVYIDSKGDPNNDTLVCQQSAKIIADRSFHAGYGKEATLKTASGSPVWVYNFDYYSKDFYPSDWPFDKGAGHAHELCYVFLRVLPEKDNIYDRCPNQYDGEYRIIADHMGEMWTNFAKTGNPSSNGFAWPNFKNVTSANAMRIRTDLGIEPHFYVAEENFWMHLLPNVEKTLP